MPKKNRSRWGKMPKKNRSQWAMVPTGQKKGSNTNGNKTIQSRIEKVTRPNDKLNIHK